MVRSTPAHLPSELRKLLLAQTPADFADWLDFVAIGALLAFNWNAEPFVFAVLAVSIGLPYLIVGPFAGVLVDRIDTKRVMIWSNLSRAIVTALFFFAPNWPVLMGLIVLRAAVDTFFTPSKQSAIQALTTTENRTRANAWSHAINQASKIVAPAMGGGLLIWLQPQIIFLMNAFVSLLAAVLLMRLHALPKIKESAAAETAGQFGTLKQGLAEVSGSPVLRAAIGMMAAGYFAMFFYDTLIAPLTRDLGYTQTHLGFALSAVGAGGVLGSIWLGMASDIKRPFAMVAIGAGVSGVTIAMIGAAEMLGHYLEVALFIVGFGVLGLCSALSVVPIRTVIQNNVSETSVGKITALSEALNTSALLVAPFIGAWVAGLSSIGAAFVCGGALMLLVALRAATVQHHK